MDPTMNPHLKYTNSRDHGYMLLDINKEKVIATWKYVETLIRRDKSIKEIKKIESISRSNKLKLVNK